jgi:hypothetical protein
MRGAGCRVFSLFLRTSKALKSLVFYVQNVVTESCLSAFRANIAVILEDNASLESLCLLPTFRIQLTDDESKQMASLLKKNYALESLLEIGLKNRAGDQRRRHLAIKCTRTSVSGSRRIRHLERRRSVEQRE